MNNIEQFKNNHNISLLWDVISDEFLLNTSSQEKEIVKNIFNQVIKSKTPLGLPIELPNSAANYRLLISSSEAAEESEQISNPRSQSMRLRAIERVAA